MRLEQAVDTADLSYRDCTDPQLVKAASAGDSEAFSELARRHYQICQRMAEAIVRDPQEAEDRVQNAMLQAYLHIGEFELRSNFRSWLIRIVINQCLMSVRRGRRTRQVSMDRPHGRDTGRESRPLEFISKEPTPEEIVFRDQLKSRLQNHVGCLPGPFKVLMNRQASGTLDIREAAVELDITPEAVKSRLNRARKEMRRRLQNEFCTGYSLSAVELRRV
jgi:RNA polymerase sigma-70 factor, ECF subfamily